MAPNDYSDPTPAPAPRAGFVFATCQAASNAWLRRDVGRLQPDLRLAFSAPGLVTWKGAGALELGVTSPLAVVAGWGMGPAKSPAEVVKLVEAGVAQLRVSHPAIGLHVFHTARDAESAEDDDLDQESWLGVESQLRDLFEFTRGPNDVGAPIVDVVHLRDKPGSYFVGWHLQRADRPRRAGGVEFKALDPRAPSRAYSKVWELMRLAELEVTAGDRVVELGAAPGGGTMAWLEQGAKVTAVDPAEMSPSVTGFVGERGGAYRQLRKSAGEVQASELPRQVDILYSDMNLAPAVVLRYMERICALVGAPRKALALNLKVNDQKVEHALTQQLERIAELSRRLGLEMRVAQLPSHRQEVGVVLRRAQRANSKGKTPRA